MPRILAVDPGTAYVGLAVLDHEGTWLTKGCIKLNAVADPDAKISTLKYDLHSFCLQHFFFELKTHGSTPPNVAVVEQFKTYGLKGSGIQAFQMGRTIQAVLDTVMVTGLFKRVDTVNARDARRFVCDNPSAKDPQVKEGLRLKGYDGKSNEHERDALALGLYWLDRWGKGRGE